MPMKGSRECTVQNVGFKNSIRDYMGICVQITVNYYKVKINSVQIADTQTIVLVNVLYVAVTKYSQMLTVIHSPAQTAKRNKIKSQ